MQMQTATINYLDRTFGIKPGFRESAENKQLPLYLRKRFHLVEGVLFNREVLFAFDRGNARLTPMEIRKSIDMIGKKVNRPVIYCTMALSAIELLRLIEYRVQFIVPGKQAYLPDFMVSISNRGQIVREDKNRFTPVAQQTFLYLLVERAEKYPLGEIAERLGYTRMSISRSFDELEKKELLQTYSTGRVKFATLPDNRNIVWEKGKQYLISPVESVKYVRTQLKEPGQELYEAGITALSRFTLLADDEIKTYACTKTVFKDLLATNQCSVVEFPEDAGLKLELWKYDPRLFTTGYTVDKLSLFAALKEDPDERVQIALEEMMEDFEW